PARTSIQPHGPMQSPEAGRLPAQVAEIGRLTERCCPDADLPAVHELAGGGRESQGWRERCCAPWLPYCSAGFVPRCATGPHEVSDRQSRARWLRPPTQW